MGLVVNAAQVGERCGKLQRSRQPWQGARGFRSEAVGVIAPVSGRRAHTSALTAQPQSATEGRSGEQAPWLIKRAAGQTAACQAGTWVPGQLGLPTSLGSPEWSLASP